jgi:HAD superfamily hydrolase (TIGR01484 family)
MSDSISPSAETSTAACRAPLRLLCLDFDGTLVDTVHADSHEVHPPLVERIDRLRRGGVVWVINTGRTLEDLKEGLERAALPFAPDYVITEETSLLAPDEDHPDGWGALGDWNRHRDLAFRALLEETGRLFTEVRAFVRAETRAEYIDRPDGLDEIVARDEDEMERICHRIEEVRHEHGAGTLGYQRNTIYLRFGHRAFHKGSTLARLGHLLGIGREHILAAGDNLNDLPMLHPDVAGYLACPANSHPRVVAEVRRHGGYEAHGRTGEGLAEALGFFGFGG